MENIAIIFAGGIGSRMKTQGIPKQFLKINGTPVIVHTINNFQFSHKIDKIVIVMLEKYIPYMEELREQYNLSKIVDIVPGGKTGQESIYNGLKRAKEIVEDNAIVLIHDGVRPILEDTLIERNVESVKRFGSSISSVPSKETIIAINDNNDVEKILDRSKAWIARAPQSFYLNDILECHEMARKEKINNVIDSCSMMMKYGKQVHIVETCQENIKITTPEDYFVVQGILNAKNNEEVFRGKLKIKE